MHPRPDDRCEGLGACTRQLFGKVKLPARSGQTLTGRTRGAGEIREVLCRPSGPFVWPLGRLVQIRGCEGAANSSQN